MLRLENIWFEYQKGQPILKGVNLTVQPGEIITILGNSGSGKSTLLSVIAGLEKQTKGQIYLENQEISQVVCEKRSIGMIFQDYALFPHLTVVKNIGFACKDKHDPKIETLLRLIHMEDFKNRYPHELSGGQQQRVAIARSLAANPTLLLMDEPFSNLDATLRQEVREELKRILREQQITTILVTHDYQDAQVLSDRIIKLDKGIIVEEERVSQ